MASEQKEIFRKDALKRLSSPEQLDELIQVTTPGGWMALLAVCGLVAMALYWGFFGSVPTTLNVQGLLVSTGAGGSPGHTTMKALLYAPLTDAKKVKSGMAVQLTPSFIKKEEFGSLVGTIVSVAESPSSVNAIKSTLANEELVKTFSQISAPVEIQVELEQDPTTVSGYKWSSSAGPQAKLTSGTMCAATVIVNEQTPISLVLPFLKSLMQ